MRILITGATGNVGRVALNKLKGAAELYAGVRDPISARVKLGTDLHYCQVDFEKAIHPSQTFDAVLLVRPPRLANPKLFKAFLASLQSNTKVVFLSVQGADKKGYLPHAKIEKLIRGMGLTHVFLRPSYFMENLTTTLYQELIENHRIYLPSAGLKLNWIAVEDIAEVASIALTQDLEDDALELTNTETHDFSEVIEIINKTCGTTFRYESPSLLNYLAYSFRRRQGLGYTLIMLLLHYLPRFSRATEGHSDVIRITGKQAKSLSTFVREHCAVFDERGI